MNRFISDPKNSQKINGNTVSCCNNQLGANSQKKLSLNEALEDCFAVIREIVENRKLIQNNFEQRYFGGTETINMLNIYRLPENATGLDRLLKEHKTERTYVIALLMKLDCKFNINKFVMEFRIKLNKWDGCIKSLALLRATEKQLKERCSIENTSRQLLEDMTKAIKELTEHSKEVHTWLWKLLDLFEIPYQIVH